MAQSKNEYLEQVINQQNVVELELQSPAARRKRAIAPARQAALPNVNLNRNQAPIPAPPVTSKPSTEMEKALSVRITGIWPFQTVVVPPNVYVIHTRAGQSEPVNVGLGLSFRYTPWTDAFLLVPATIQTILINARGICAERQGVLLQAYVQWIVADIEKAYRKLDFSDPEDPMRVVNVQLREQAEAAMKDKISTMHIDEVLTDKRSIIDELTSRLREVAEGDNKSESGGLGLKIVTVQIKEAVVSSTRVWENLQRPYRADQEKKARLAEIEAQREVHIREQAEHKRREIADIATEEELDKLKHEQEIERYSREQAEERRRYQLQQELEQRKLEDALATEMLKREKEQELKIKELELETARSELLISQIKQKQALELAEAERQSAELQAQLNLQRIQAQADHELKLLELKRLELQTKIANDISHSRLQQELLQQLPKIANSLPQVHENRRVHISSDGQSSQGDLLHQLTGLVTGLSHLASGGFASQKDRPAASESEDSGENLGKQHSD